MAPQLASEFENVCGKMHENGKKKNMTELIRWMPFSFKFYSICFASKRTLYQDIV